MFVHSGGQSGGPALWIGGIHVSSPMKVVRRDDLKAQRTTKQMNESNVDPEATIRDDLVSLV